MFGLIVLIWKTGEVQTLLGDTEKMARKTKGLSKQLIIFDDTIIIL